MLTLRGFLRPSKNFSSTLLLSGKVDGSEDEDTVLFLLTVAFLQGYFSDGTTLFFAF